MEDLLKGAFRDDDIAEVKKGQRGADVLQKVHDKRGRFCGAILWESKNAHWSEGWLAKLRADQREAKAQVAVLVAVQPPAEIETFAYREGVWIVQRRYAKELALLLRYSVIQISSERANQAGKDEKMEVLYQYLTARTLANIFFEIGVAGVLGKPVQLIWSGRNPRSSAAPSDFIRTEWVRYSPGEEDRFRGEVSDAIAQIEEGAAFYTKIGNVAFEALDPDLELAFERFKQAVLISNDREGRQGIVRIRDRSQNRPAPNAGILRTTWPAIGSGCFRQ